MKTRIKNLATLAQKEFAYFVRGPRRVLFDHLAKCAGTTIGQYLKRQYLGRLVFTIDEQESVKAFQLLPERSRYRYHLIKGHGAHDLLDYVHPDTITLTIFREPIERIVSHYLYVKQCTKHHLHDRVINSGIELKDYASSGISCELRNWYTTHFTGLSLDAVESNPDDSVPRAARIITEKYGVVGFQDQLIEAMCKLRTAESIHEPFRNII